MNWKEDYKLAIKRAYYRIKDMYLSGRVGNSAYMEEYNPIKHSFELGEHNKECVTKCTNVMFAKSNQGNLTKVISLDDDTGTTNEDIIYTHNDMTIVRESNIGLTPLRCGLMALVATDLNYEISEDTKIGFIGTGNINAHTLELITMCYGSHDIVIRGSKKNRAKNRELYVELNGGKDFNVIVDDTSDLRKLNECDIIYCCTTSTSKDEMININQLPHPKLFVVQDCGYVFDESFRKFTMPYTDYADQLTEHYKEEFPHDNYDWYIHNMRDTVSKKSEFDDCVQKSVYLYGVAFADIIVFEEVFLKGHKQC